MTAVTQITTAYLNYKLRETGNTSIGVSLSNGSSSLCNRKLGSTGCQLVVFWFYSHRKARLPRLLFKPIPALTMLLFVEDFWIVCSRSASFWLDAEVVHVNFCLLGSSMYVDIRFATFSDLLQTHCCIITNRLHAIINLTPFKHKLIADFIFYHLPDASKWLRGGQLNDRRPGLRLWSNHFKCNKTTSPGMKKWQCFVKSTLCDVQSYRISESYNHYSQTCCCSERVYFNSPYDLLLEWTSTWSPGL